MTHTKDRDLGERVRTAVERRDSETLFQLHHKLKEQGEDEYAQILLDNARRIDREDMAFDEARDNDQIDV